MDWSDDSVLEFLELYKNEPVIWNPFHPQHRVRNETYEAWKNIETKMGQRYKIEDLKRKRESLMASFRFCCNKVKASKRKSEKPEDVYKPCWFAYQKMASFLGENDILRKPKSEEKKSGQEYTEKDDNDHLAESKRLADVEDDKMDWSNETVFEFLDLYKNEPVIWNTFHPHHRDRNKVCGAWKSIAIKMGQKYSIKELKRKRESLMASFRTCCNKIKASKRRSERPEDVYKPSWFAYKKMASFLGKKDLLRKTNSQENTRKDIIQEYTEKKDNNDMIECKGLVFMGKEGAATRFQEKRSGQEHTENDVEDNTLVSPSNATTTSNLPQKKMKRDSEGCDLKTSTNQKYLITDRKTIESSVQKRREKNVCDIFGELVAAKLKVLDDHKREIAMHNIDNILFEIKMNSSMPHYDHSYPFNNVHILASPHYSQGSTSSHQTNSSEVPPEPLSPQPSDEAI